MTAERHDALLVVAVVVGLVALPALAGPAAGTERGQEIVVAADGSGDYGTIAAAVDAAGDGDRILVRPGTYPGTVFVDVDVTVAAPDGATLESAGPYGEAYGVLVASDADVTLSGLTVSDYDRGVEFQDGSGDWTLANLTLRGNRVGVGATAVAGDWTVRDARFVGNERYGVDLTARAGANGSIEDSTFRNNTVGARVSSSGPASVAIRGGDFRDNVGGATVRGATNLTVEGVAFRETGSLVATVDGSEPVGIGTALEVATDAGTHWTAEDVAVSGGFDGIYVHGNASDWRIRNATVRGVNHTAIGVVGSDADWTIEGARVLDNGVGLSVEGGGGDWTVRDSVFENATVHPWFADTGWGVLVVGATGDWRIANSTLAGNERTAVAAGSGAAYEDGEMVVETNGSLPEGDATGNWWGRAGGAAAGQCVGAVDCTDPLANPPGAPEETSGTASGPVSVVVPVVAAGTLVALGAYARRRG
jgi:hypothetical protein